MAQLRFTAPVGTWELDESHFNGPATHYFAEALAKGLPAGFTNSLERYGVPLDLKIHFANQFAYMSMRPIGAPAGAKGPPPKFLFQLLFFLHPELRRRTKLAKESFDKKLWRTDLEHWDNELKPRAIGQHRALFKTDLRDLSHEQLASHLEACFQNLTTSLYHHHRLSIPSTLPIGDFIHSAQEWTGLSENHILEVFQGLSQTTRGSAELELDRLVNAILQSSAWERLVTNATRADAALVLSSLRATKDICASLERYLDVVGPTLLTGHDITSPTLIEKPEIILTSIQQRLKSPRIIPWNEKAEEHLTRLRDRVPVCFRDEFDNKFAEAKLMYRLRDERVYFGELTASGISRASILAAGRYLCSQGFLKQPELLLEASHEEMMSYLIENKEPSSAQLEDRLLYRTTMTNADAPKVIGPAPLPPPDFDWFPSDLRRTIRSIDFAIQNVIKDSEKRHDAKKLRGFGVGSGSSEGRVCLVLNDADFSKIQKGDILVAKNTSVTCNIILPLVKGIITDRGGVLSHAAIIAREFGIPAVVGTREATSFLKDGMKVKVDGQSGEVEVL